MPNVAVEVRIKPNSRNVLEFSQNRISAGSKTYTFSRVHSKTTQQMLFASSVMPYVEYFLRGENCSIMAYGQTGSGKTYTMGITSKSERGIVHNALEMLFKQNLRLGCSFIEIYNEDIIDLLGDSRTPLNIRQGRNDINIVGLREVEVSSLSEAVSLLCLGSEKRTTKSTKMNSESSRSHAMFSVTMRQLAEGKVVESKMTFVDLAGSERLKRTECTGSTARESISINTGLLSLGNVISSLYLRKPHVPFRDSKLTRILQKCLTGHVLLIACVSGLQEDMFETTNTLKYASRAALISLDSRVNIETNKEKLVILNLKKEISALKDENNRLRAAAMGIGLKNEGIRSHPVVIELVNRLRMYEGEDVLQKLLASQKGTSTPLHVNEHVQKGLGQPGKGAGDRALPFSQRRAEKSPWRLGGTEEAMPEQSHARATDCPDNKIFGSGFDVSNCSPGMEGAWRQARTELGDSMQEHPKTVSCGVAVHQTHDSIESSKIACGEKIEAENGQQAGPRRRLVTFDLEPKLRKTLFTPLRECSKVSLRLVDTVRDIAAVSFTVHNNSLMLACGDGKIRSYGPKISIVLSDDSIRCMCSSNELYYSTRSLLKAYTGNGRPLPVYAYKREVTCLEISDGLIYTGHEDGTLCIVDMRSNDMVFSERIHYEPVSGIQAIGKQVYSCSWDHSVKFALLETLGGTGAGFGALMPPHYDAVSGMVSYKGRCISFGRDCSIKSWDCGSPGKTVPYAHESWIRCGCALDGFFATGCKDGVLRCWDILDRTVRCVGRLDFDSGISCMVGHENSIWVGCQNKTIYRYEFNRTSILE